MTESKFVGGSILAKQDKRSKGILDRIVVSQKMLDLFLFDLAHSLVRSPLPGFSTSPDRLGIKWRWELW
jgi:hypothetical protein